MRSVEELESKTGELEYRLNELYKISESFSGDNVDETYEKGVLLEIDALDGTVLLLRMLVSSGVLVEENVFTKFVELSDLLASNIRVIEEYEDTIPVSADVDAIDIHEDEDMRVEMDWKRDDVFVLENKVRLLRWLLEQGEDMK